MPIGEKTKFLWENPEYRLMMSIKHKGIKKIEHSKRMMGNKNAFRGRTIEILCPICQKNTFKKFISQIKKYCSVECVATVRRNKMLNNQIAVGNKLSNEHKKIISDFISKTRNQENNPNWKGGSRREHKILYGSRFYKEWRKSVFERDNYTCQTCGEKGGYIEAHHLKEWCNYPELRFDVNNGIALCKKCHNKTKNGKYTKI